MSVEINLIESLLRQSIRALALLLRYYPYHGLVASLVMLGLTMGAVILLEKNFPSKQNEANVSEQLQQLDETQVTLKNLGDFIQGQRQQLEESERILTDLKNEQQQLQPIVESNRDAVTAILQAQAQSQRADIWWERGFGFLLGIISSLVASFIFAILWNKYVRPRVAGNPEST